MFWFSAVSWRLFETLFTRWQKQKTIFKFTIYFCPLWCCEVRTIDYYPWIVRNKTNCQRISRKINRYGITWTKSIQTFKKQISMLILFESCEKTPLPVFQRQLLSYIVDSDQDSCTVNYDLLAELDNISIRGSKYSYNLTNKSNKNQTTSTHTRMKTSYT